ncbi:hypothetical protein RclHR1_04690010 [Rhizophagus clarus]|uniref:MIR domain-containing protein n=1 Tax=Rhizophagus clarus TaxID=94130 RepID=A0A2Z6SCV0_9GLOM|nr:hypothetical protein RclHR1_04690010 [Rhizophagus clarus]GES95027.1 hypothetical protein GLOIN_2v1767340 [Rhizophagus clarus]
MDFPKYDGNIHPNEWINDFQNYLKLITVNNNNKIESLDIAISLIDPTISLPTGIDSFDKLRNALKKDISFDVFKNTNKRKLQSLKYNSERKGGDTSKFISTFRKLCYNAEINDIKEQKKFLYSSLPNNQFDYISNKYYKKVENVKSINELIREFENIVLEESNLIRNESIVALKHVATGKYLSSISNLNYRTGSNNQMVYVGETEPNPNSLWKIQFDKELATYADTSIKLQHVKSNNFLGICYEGYQGYDEIKGKIYGYHKSPATKHTEVNCSLGKEINWNWINPDKLGNSEEYLKSKDVIQISIRKLYDEGGYSTKSGPVELLRSRYDKFTLGDDEYLEVVCHENEKVNINWRIELINYSN